MSMHIAHAGAALVAPCTPIGLVPGRPLLQLTQIPILISLQAGKISMIMRGMWLRVRLLLSGMGSELFRFRVVVRMRHSVAYPTNFQQTAFPLISVWHFFRTKMPAFLKTTYISHCSEIIPRVNMPKVGAETFLGKKRLYLQIIQISVQYQMHWIRHSLIVVETVLKSHLSKILRSVFTVFSGILFHACFACVSHPK